LFFLKLCRKLKVWCYVWQIFSNIRLLLTCILYTDYKGSPLRNYDRYTLMYLLRNYDRQAHWFMSLPISLFFFFVGYCSTVQGFLDWFVGELWFTRAFIHSNRFVCSVCFCSLLPRLTLLLSFLDILHCLKNVLLDILHCLKNVRPKARVHICIKYTYALSMSCICASVFYVYKCKFFICIECSSRIVQSDCLLKRLGVGEILQKKCEAYI